MLGIVEDQLQGWTFSLMTGAVMWTPALMQHWMWGGKSRRIHVGWRP